MSKFNFFNPARQNSTQRLGFFLSLASILILVLLHNPVDGYTMTHEVEKEYYENKCSESEHAEMGRALAIFGPSSQAQDRMIMRQQEKALGRWSGGNEFTQEEDKRFISEMDKELNNELANQGIYPSSDKEKLDIVKKSRDKWNYLMAKCNSWIKYQVSEYLPFWKWTTKEPLVLWLGSLIHLISAIVASLSIGFVWVFAFSLTEYNEH
jgi:hypothetical protein